MCARLAAGRISDEQLSNLKTANAGCETQSDIPIAIYTTTEMWIFMSAFMLHANRFLANETRALRRRLQSFRRLQLRARGRMPQSLTEHIEIIEAIETGMLTSG